jgi:hypothetical protein
MLQQNSEILHAEIDRTVTQALWIMSTNNSKNVAPVAYPANFDVIRQDVKRSFLSELCCRHQTLKFVEFLVIILVFWTLARFVRQC